MIQKDHTEASNGLIQINLYSPLCSALKLSKIDHLKLTVMQYDQLLKYSISQSPSLCSLLQTYPLEQFTKCSTNYSLHSAHIY